MKKDSSEDLEIDLLIEHEALHTTNMITEILEDHLINHWYYDSKFNPEYNALIDKAGEALSEAYQSIAQHSNSI